MLTTPKILALAALSAAAFFPGCVVREQTTLVEERPRRVYVADPAPVVVQPGPVVVQPAPVIVQPAPIVVQPAPVVATPAPVVIVHGGPPPVLVERVGPRPGRTYAWVPGYYVAERGGWVWVAGRWEVPPHAGAVWVPPRYEPHGADVHFSLGFWR